MVGDLNANYVRLRLLARKCTTEDFFIVAKEVLKPFGLIVMNVMVEHDIDLLADKIALNMESSGLPSTLFDWPGRTNRNTVIAAGQVNQMQISVQKKPKFVRGEMRGIVRRAPKKCLLRDHY